MVRVMLTASIKVYRVVISPFLGPRCRFYPSCSQYALTSLERDPLPRALKKIMYRLWRCQPRYPGGIDFP